MKYRKKPVIVVAYQTDKEMIIHTLEGDMKMKNKSGDYLVRDVQGKFYFCEKSLFEQTYEEADGRTYACSSTLY